RIAGNPDCGTGGRGRARRAFDQVAGRLPGDGAHDIDAKSATARGTGTGGNRAGRPPSQPNVDAHQPRESCHSGTPSALGKGPAILDAAARRPALACSSKGLRRPHKQDAPDDDLISFAGAAFATNSDRLRVYTLHRRRQPWASSTATPSVHNPHST